MTWPTVGQLNYDSLVKGYVDAADTANAAYADTTAQADVTAANVAIIQAAGFRVFLYTPVHQNSCAAALATGCDGIFTNEPPSWAQSTNAYRQTSTSFHLTGKWETGTLALGDNSYAPEGSLTKRGTIIGPGAGGYRISLNAGGSQRGPIIGSVCPVANAASSYTITASFVIDTIPTTTSQGPGIYFAMPDDSTTNGGSGSDMANSYFIKLRANGGVALFEVASGGSATSLGTSTCTAFQILTTTSSLSGAITALPVSALTVALKVGHQFMMPTGQVATVSVAASIGATSVSISSLTLSATVASSSSLLPYVTALVTVNSTTVTAARGDETSVTAISSANTAHRGGYLAASSTSFSSPGACSLHKVTIT